MICTVFQDKDELFFGLRTSAHQANCRVQLGYGQPEARYNPPGGPVPPDGQAPEIKIQGVLKKNRTQGSNSAVQQRAFGDSSVLPAHSVYIDLMPHTRKLLLIIEAGGYGNLLPLLEGLGFEVAIETSARRGMGRLKTWQPDVLVADFYKRYFHDRVSNLESLLAVATRNPATRIIVLYDPFHAADLELLKQRHRIDVALTLPLSASALQDALSVST